MINPLLEMEIHVRVLKSHVAVYCNISQLNVSFKTQHWNRQHSEKITAADRPQIPQLTLLALVSGMILDILPKCKTQAICDVYYHFYSIRERHAQLTILDHFKMWRTHCNCDFDMTLLWPGPIGPLPWRTDESGNWCNLGSRLYQFALQVGKCVASCNV